jgi:hypothetical protein
MDGKKHTVIHDEKEMFKESKLYLDGPHFETQSFPEDKRLTNRPICYKIKQFFCI